MINNVNIKRLLKNNHYKGEITPHYVSFLNSN
jgi:hypothetical protein